VLGTTERFDETTLVATRALNWSVLDAASPPAHRQSAPQPAEACYKRGQAANRMANLPWWCRHPGKDPKAERARVHRRVCPNATSCAEVVRSVAPVDMELYRLASARLDAAVSAGGAQFKEQLRLLRRANKAPGYLPGTKAPMCVWRAIRPTVVSGAEMEKDARARIMQIAPNFTSPSACVPGDDAVMRAIWSEHKFGGRTATGWPLSTLAFRNGRRGGARASRHVHRASLYREG